MGEVDAVLLLDVASDDAEELFLVACGSVGVYDLRLREKSVVYSERLRLPFAGR